MEITNTEGRVYAYYGSLNENLEVNDIDLSNMLRKNLIWMTFLYLMGKENRIKHNPILTYC